MTESNKTSNPEFENDLDLSLPVLDAETLRRGVRTIMKHPLTITLDTSIAEAIRLMQTKHIGCVLITSDRKLYGIFTERDVLKKLIGAGFNLDTTPIAEVMTTNPQYLHDDDTIAFSLNYMYQGGFRHIPIVNSDLEPVGIVSVKDIVSYLVERFADEILNLPMRQASPEGESSND